MLDYAVDHLIPLVEIMMHYVKNTIPVHHTCVVIFFLHDETLVQMTQFIKTSSYLE